MRKRIVEGTLKKITEGEHNIFSNKNIILETQGKIFHKGENDGVLFSPPKAPVSNSVCAVYFFPHKEWTGEFGMDWKRDGNSKMQVDIDYKNITGSYGNTYATEKGAKFTTKTADYNSLCSEYPKINFSDPELDTYYVPYVTLYPKETAKFDIRSHIIDIPDSMKYEFDSGIFDLSILKKVTKSKGINYDDSALSITCKKAFSDKQYITLMAKKNGKDYIAGQITILPNAVTKDINIVFIPVNVTVDGKKKNGGAKTGENDKTEIFFKQAYINAKIETAKAIDIDSSWFNFWFTTTNNSGKKILTTSNWVSIHNYLDGIFFKDKTNEKYKKYFRVYLFLQEGDLNGIAKEIGCSESKSVCVVYGSRGPETTAHEIMHTMGLYHSFDNDSKYTFKLYNTDNLLDYTHQKYKNRISTNYFQWKKLNSSTPW